MIVTFLYLWHAYLVLDLRLHFCDRVTGLDLERNSFACDRLQKDVHVTPTSEH